MTITLKPGMYVSTEGMSESEYHQVAKAFMDAGCPKGEYPESRFAGWVEGGEGFSHWGDERCFGDERQMITISQALSTLNEEQEWVPTVGERYLDADGDQVTVIATQGGWAWVKLSDAAGFLSPVSMLSPIPVKSERDIAVEEMVLDLMSYDGEHLSVDRFDFLADHLYEAGYRKK